MLRLFMLNVFGGPSILGKFKMPEKNTQEIHCTNNFALFSSYNDLKFWEEFMDKENSEYSYLILDITNNACSKNLAGYFDVRIKNGTDIIKLLNKFGGETKETSQDRIDEILDKINKKGMKSLNEEEKQILKSFKQD